MRFGIFELDLRAGELRKGGRKIRLQEQPLQILAMLLASPGEVVTREEIRQKLWSNDTTVEFDHSINAAIKRLRDALGDSAERPRFVETLPRRGYRFIAAVESSDTSTAPAPPPSAVSAPAATRTERRVPAALSASAASAVLLALAAAIWIGLAHTTTRAPASSPITVPLTGNSGIETLPSFSPDGQQVAYAWDRATGGSLDIYVKLIGGGPPLRLTDGDADEYSPAWSPDGRQIAFLRRSTEGAGIFVIPALGGPERKLGELSARWFPAGIWYGKVSWSPDGRLLALVDRGSPRGVESILLLTIATGEKRHVTSPSAEWPFGDASPVFSPDGRMLAFERAAGMLVSDIYVQPLSSDGTPAGSARRVTSDRRGVYALDWTPDGREIVFSSNRGGPFALWTVAASGGAPEPLASGESGITWLSVARRGRRAAYTHPANYQSIWRADGPLAISATAGESDRSRARLIFSQRGSRDPQFSPDGRSVAFQSGRSGYAEIWISDADGSSPQQVTNFAGPAMASPRWSPDGRRIAFDSSKDGLRNVYVIDRDGRGLRRLTADGFTSRRPSWSSDGAWIYFASARGGAWQVWKVPAGGGQPVQVTRNGGSEAFESRDGKYVYYSKNEGAGIWRIPVNGGEETQVTDQGTMSHWALLDRGICFVNLMGKRPAIEFFDFANRHVATVAVLPKDAVPAGGWGFPAIAVSPDGRSVLYVQAERTESHIQLVENFR
jgi:Tol biopolymer transport system component/DNA-binding winged helix-turn-helix (wHTH) protein